MPNNIHILSLNAQGLRDKTKRGRMLQWLMQQNANILFVQETHFTDELSNLIRKEFSEWEIYHSYGTSNSKGCSIFLKKELNFNIIDYHTDVNGRFIIINTEIANSVYTLVNIYAFNDMKSRDNFFQSLHKLLNEFTQGLKIIAGDYNDTLSKTDRISKSNTKQQKCPVKCLEKIIKEFNLIDIWRVKNPNASQYTWRRKNNSEKSRIDFFLTDENLLPLIENTDIRPAQIKYTDHMAVSLKIRIPSKRGPGFWKLNNSYLLDDTYKTLINNTIDTCLNELGDHECYQTIWEYCKYEIKETSIQFAKHKSKQRKTILKDLETKLQTLQSLPENDLNDNILSEIENTQKQIEEIYHFKAVGAQVRSRIQYLEEGEKNSKYFLSLENSRQTRKLMTSIVINNKRFTNTKEVLKEERKFYENLFKSTQSKININEYLSSVKLEKKLTNEEADICEGLFTFEECKQSVEDLKINKSPGSDGLTAEFYKIFWPKIGNLVTNTLNNCYMKTEMSRTQKQSIISLIFKKGDPENIENWRPISLLNTDYKIAARTLAKRIQKVLPKIISLDQQGYIKNRFIGFNIRQIQDIIDYTDIFEIDGAILFLDFRKAFDTLEWASLLEVIKHFGFKTNFINWVKTLYKDINSCIINNGWKCNMFAISRGVRQGCPLSALLFIIVAEILAIKIRSCDIIKGISVKVNNKTHALKISQLADDTTLFLKDENDIEQALKIIYEFGNFSGLKLNKNKTSGLWIGASKAKSKNIFNISWSENPIKALGIYFGHDKVKCENLNWENRLQQCADTIKNWQKRYLTFYGKIQIIKTLLIPKFTYLLQSLVAPKHIINKINSMLFDFLWNGKREKIKRTTLIGNREEGGLGMIDIETYMKSIKIKWIQHLLNNEIANWKCIPHFFLDQFGTNFLIFYMNYNSPKTLPQVKYKIPSFYTDIVSIWSEVNNKHKQFPNNFYNIRKEIIWGNKHILLNGKNLIFKHWIDSGILFLNDLIGENGHIQEQHTFLKLKNKTNWLSEFNRVLKSIPCSWRNILKTNNSVMTKVKTSLSISLDLKIKFTDMTNKNIYRTLLKYKFCKPYIHRYWEQTLNSRINWNVYYNILNQLIDNRVKQFKYKTIHRILPTRDTLHKWRISDSSNCLFCNQIETIEHMLIYCKCLDSFWNLITSVFVKCGISKCMRTLHFLIVGYKIEIKQYIDVNRILNLICFCTYKSYFLSEKRTIFYPIHRLFHNELTTMLQHLVSKKKNSAFLQKFKFELDTILQITYLH